MAAPYEEERLKKWLDNRMMRLRKAIVPALILTGVWFSIWVSYAGALAINNYARREGVTSLPPVTEWFLFASRYRIIHVAGVLVSALAILAAVRKTQSLQNALSLFLVSALVFVSFGFAIFVIFIGACMCDDWKQWEKHNHPTKASTATNQPVRTAD